MAGLRTAVLGAGAVGSFFGGMLARAGASVTLIGRDAHVDAVRRQGLAIERGDGVTRIEVAASTRIADTAGANLVLVCVKTPDTEDIARALAPHLAADVLVISFQNGVDNVERMRRSAGIAAAGAAVYVAADLIAPGRVRHGGRGDLVLGEVPSVPLGAKAGRPTLADVATQFERAQVPCRVVPDIREALWTKMVLNCAYNALSALGRTQYGPLIEAPGVRDLMLNVVDEVLAVAHASGVTLPRTSIAQAVFDLARGMPTATSSTAQDLARGRRTEIDSLNGFIAREGERLGIAVPHNRTLHVLVKLLESAPRSQRMPS
jgi:2-dehydropantoate 2-reductase